MSFMVGGFHTIGNFIVWLLWHLANHQDMQKQLREELKRETGGERGYRLKKYAEDVCHSYKS